MTHSRSLSSSLEKRVLIIEDDTQLLDYVSAQFIGLGFSISTAGTLSEALALLDREPFDLVFTDIALPKGAGGLDLAYWVKAVRAQTPVLLTSAYPTEALASADTTAGDFPLLLKPYRRADLEQAINKVLAPRA